MAVDDDQIGRNLLRARGGVSQAELAERMRERGWRWSQGTVSSIESGERPLRLAEAAEVADVLGLESADDLVRAADELHERYLRAMKVLTAGARLVATEAEALVRHRDEVLAVAAEVGFSGEDLESVRKLVDTYLAATRARVTTFLPDSPAPPLSDLLDSDIGEVVAYVNIPTPSD